MLIFAVTFGAVFFKAFQQRNVTESRYGLMMLTSYAMAGFEIFIIYTVATHDDPGLWLWVQMGTGGSLGGAAAVWFHKRMTR